MEKIYKSPEADLIILRANVATAYIPGTDADKSVAPLNNSDIGDGGVGLSGGSEEFDRENT